MLNANKVLLLLLYRANKHGKELNRTISQKLLYFLKIISEKRKHEYLKDVNFKPHYYGPYSPDISEAIDTLQAIHLIKENTNEHENYTEYTYELMGKSKIIAQSIEEENTEIVKLIDELIQVLPIDSTRLISIMAKTYYIIKSNLTDSNETISTVQIIDKAEYLGWEVISDEINNAAEKLEKLGLVEKR